MLLEDGKALLSKDTSGMELMFLSGVPSLLSIANVPPTVRHVDVAGEALTQAVVDNLRCVLCLPQSVLGTVASRPTRLTADRPNVFLQRACHPLQLLRAN